MNPTFSYETVTGVVTGPHGDQHPALKVESGPWTVCAHLQPLLAALLGAGAQIAYVTGPGSWSLIDLDVPVNRAPAGVLPADAQLPKGLNYWSNTDTHYPILSGVSCKADRQTLSWPPILDGQ